MSRRRWGHSGAPARGTPRRSLVVSLVLASVSLMLLEAGGTPVAAPARAVAGEVFGPAEKVASAAVRPVTALPDWVHSRRDLNNQIATLTAQNQQLATQLHQRPYEQNRLGELDGLTATAADLGYALVPAHVIGMGPSQSFNDTVTIDAGSDAGLRPNMTVVNGDGLVGRILAVTTGTATVLTVVDPDSTVGARVGRSMEVGFLRGGGRLDGDDALDLDLVDQQAVPARHDSVVTWGGGQAGQSSGPYVSGVPIGEVTSVYRSVRDSSQRVRIRPYVNFSALDLVGVVVPTGTTSDRSVIEADGSVR